ncbi:MAG TPA: NAD(P)-binding domain-containing protein, partial [Gemmatimonadaceae bacterium]|nr:NAD(P)-binding domain-containing protein [Gemmatimonadaceae bacterium]
MRISVLGTGVVGRALAGRSAELGHQVAVGTRDPQATLARTDSDSMGNPPFSVWLEEHPDVELLPFADAAARGELIVNATSGGSSLEVLGLAGAGNLAGKVLVDIANPLDFSEGFPPTLSVMDTDSLAEQIQRAFPDAKVVKTLNTLNAALMVDPAKLADADHTIFVSGDDAGAKATVTELLRSFGWQDVIDLGDLSSARGAEMLLPIWLRLMNTLGTAAF